MNTAEYQPLKGIVSRTTSPPPLQDQHQEKVEQPSEELPAFVVKRNSVDLIIITQDAAVLITWKPFKKHN